LGAGKSLEKTLMVSSRKIVLDLVVGKLIDVPKELQTIEKEIKNLENLVIKTDALLNNQNFLQSAQAEIVKSTRVRAEEYRDKLNVQRELKESLKSLL
jgi:valyl-tRNA synthetase